MATILIHEAAVVLGCEDEAVIVLAQQGKLLVSGDGYIDKASVLGLLSHGQRGVDKAISDASLTSIRQRLEELL